MPGSIEVIECAPQLDGQRFLDELRRPRSSGYVLVHAQGVRVGEDAVAAMLAAATAPMAATVSPLPVPAAGALEVAVVALDTRLPPAPSVAIGCPQACLVSCDALASVALQPSLTGADWQSTFTRVNQWLSDAGWRHVAAPGVVLAWRADATAVGSGDGAWSRGMIEQQNGAANEGLSTHVLWAETRLRPVRIVIDGACLTDAPHNGSQAVVANVARALRRTRPDATVALAVPRRFARHIAHLMAADGVDVIERDRRVGGFDVVYRPYQLLDPGELTWLAEAGGRLLVGQLDMIAFSNPSYHPSAALFHAVRNLQRRTMRFADGVTFISEFGLQTALAECPDLDRTRCFVVSCGVDAAPTESSSSSEDDDGPVDRPFIACVAATFWHKNRQHAIAVFAELCSRHAYGGLLVFAGPEPYYGRSTGEEQRAMAALAPDIRRRIVHLGQVDEPTKWWVLAAADLVLYPSVVEGFGLLPFEAASAGTPSLSHAGSALREVLGDGPAVVPSWSVDVWADAAADIIRSPDRAAEVLGSVGRAAGIHRWDDSAARIWDAIDSTLARPHAGRHLEEGGLRSCVADDDSPLVRGAKLAHVGNRLGSYIERRAAKLRSRTTHHGDAD